MPSFTQETCTTPQTFGENIQNRVTAFIANLKGHFESFVPKKSPSAAVRVLDIERDRSAIEEFKTISVPKDPFISPYLASDEALKQLPPVKILVSVTHVVCGTDCVTSHMFSLLDGSARPLSRRLRYVWEEIEEIGVQCYIGCIGRFTAWIFKFRFGMHLKC